LHNKLAKNIACTESYFIDLIGHTRFSIMRGGLVLKIDDNNYSLFVST